MIRDLRICFVGDSFVAGTGDETALGWVPPQMATYHASGKLPRKMGTENFGIAPYKAYQSADGGWVVIAAGVGAAVAAAVLGLVGGGGGMKIS